jgi:hypothetical protein
MAETDYGYSGKVTVSSGGHYIKDISSKTATRIKLPYSRIEFEVTLRCNTYCSNCLRFCNMKDLTGLDFSDTDITIEQTEKLIKDIEKLGPKTVVYKILITGGEPLLHPKLIEIVNMIKTRLLDVHLINELLINSNLTIEIPEEIKKYIVNYTKVEDKPFSHQVMFLHPDDLNVKRPTYFDCSQGGKLALVYSNKGYNVCCQSDGYIRLFNLEHLFIDTLPADGIFPFMDEVCQHCLFGTGKNILEKNVSRPISKIYEEQFKLNKK